MRPLVALLAMALSGCTHAAILELSVELPAAAGDVRHAVIDARPGEGPSFDDEGELASFELGARAAVSIVAGEDHTAPLEVRVRFCTSERCETDASPPEVRVAIERPFYTGVHTFVALRIDAIPSGLERLPDVDKCQVRGCSGSMGASYCLSDGTHLCEQ